jgi:hypothetical protein
MYMFSPNGSPDVSAPLFWLPLGLFVSITFLITGWYEVDRRLEEITSELNDLRPYLEIKSIVARLDWALSLLDDVDPGQVKVGKQILRVMRNELAPPLSPEEGTQESDA